MRPFNIMSQQPVEERIASMPTIKRAIMGDVLSEVIKKRKREKFATRFEKYQQDPIGFITEVLGVDFHDYEDLPKVVLSVRDNQVTLAKSSNAVGKTFIAAHVAVWWLMVYPESQVWMTSAPPLENLKNLLWGEISSIINKNPELFYGYEISSLKILRPGKVKGTKDKSGIYGVAIPTTGTEADRESKFNGKHAPQIMFIVDEGDAVPTEVYRGIDGCLSGGLPRMLVMFNPRAQRGPIYDKEAKGLANIVELSAFRHPNVITGEEVIEGAVTREKTVQRINERTRPFVDGENPEADTFDVPNFLVGATAISQRGIEYPPLLPGKRVIVDPSFSYQVLGRYPKQSENQLISEEWILAARRRYDEYVAEYGERPPEGMQAKMGLDVAEFGVDMNAACFRYGPFVAPLYRWSGLDPVDTGDKALKLYLSRDTEMLFVDALGVGSSVAPYVSRKGKDHKVRAISVKVSEAPSPMIQTELGDFYQKRDQLWWAMREWLKDPANGAMLPPQNQLLEELRTPTYSYDKHGGRITVMSKETMRDFLGRSPNYADALSLTFEPYRVASVVTIRY